MKVWMTNSNWWKSTHVLEICQARWPRDVHVGSSEYIKDSAHL